MIRISALALCLAASPAMGQSASDTMRRPFEPGDPAVKGPALEYRSVFGNQPAAAQPEIAWPEANEEMAKLRGHAGHIREADGESAKSQPAQAGRATNPHHRH